MEQWEPPQSEQWKEQSQLCTRCSAGSPRPSPPSHHPQPRNPTIKQPSNSPTALAPGLQPGKRFNNIGFADNFISAIKTLGIDQTTGPQKSAGIPLLLLAIGEVERSADFAESKKWMTILEAAPKTPWLQFDFQASVWRGPHPLWALAQSAQHYSNPADARWPEVAEAFIQMGFKPDGSMPPGRGQKMGLPAASFASEAPNALWAFLKAAECPQRIDALFSLLMRHGADWTKKARWEGFSEPVPLLAGINLRAKTLRPHMMQPGILSGLEDAFALTVQRGANPLDVLPRPSVQEIVSGRIRQMVDAKIEQQQLAQAISDSDLQEAMALLAEKRARQAEEAAKTVSQGAVVARPRGARL